MASYEPLQLTPSLLAQVERWTRLAGWSRHHVKAVERFWHRVGEPQPFRVIDVGCGLGGLLEDVHAWAQRRGIEVELGGCEPSAELVSAARDRLGDKAFVYEGDLTHLGCGADAWHLACCSLVLNQLSGHDRIRLVTELGRVAKTAYLFDVSKNVATEVGARLIPWITGGGDAPPESWVESVEHAPTFPELQRLVEALPVEVVRVFPGALCTMPEPVERVKLQRPEGSAVRVTFDMPELGKGLAGNENNRDAPTDVVGGMGGERA